MTLDDGNTEEVAARAAEVLRAGGVIIYPTDTLYGLGADALSRDAFLNVCVIKDRDQRRPIHAVFADLAMAAEYAEISPMGETLARKFLPGPLTLVFKKKEHVTTGIGHNLASIGVRIPKHALCLALARHFGKPYTTTSANRSGEESPATLAAVLRQLGANTRRIDLAIDGGALPSFTRSSVVDVRGREPFIIREGAISARDIRRALIPPTQPRLDREDV